MRARQHSTLLGVGLLTTALLTGCAGDPWDAPNPEPSAVGALGSGFLEPSTTPTPEATVVPEAGSWDDVRPSRGYRVVLLHAGDDPATSTVTAAVEQWAQDEDVDLRTVDADEDGDLVAGIVRALELAPDLVVTAGNALVDPLAVVSANHLDQDFLVVGAEVGEPTYNVTAVSWTGASFRGTGNGAASEYDAGSFTPERCAAAVRAGAAAVLHDLTGIVLWID